MYHCILNNICQLRKMTKLQEKMFPNKKPNKGLEVTECDLIYS